MSQKEIVVKPLKTIHDFTELLSLSDLKVQMGVLGFLQQNLQDYQMNYFKSQLMDWETLVEYISDKDKPLFFKDREYIYNSKTKKDRYAPYDWEYAKREYTDKDYTEDRTNKRYSTAERKFFIVDHKRKKLYTINKKLIDKFTFTYDGRYLVCNYHDMRKAITFERFALCKMHDLHHEITVWFNLDENCVEGFSDNYEYKNGGGCGSWHDTSNEKFSKNYVCDEDEPWIEEAKIKAKLDRNKSKYKKTLYKSNYGDIIIQQEKTKWIILWSEEKDNLYIRLNSTDELENFVFNYEKIGNFPKEGKFKSQLDAYNFIVNLFGKLDEAK